MYGSSIDYVEILDFSFNDESSIHPEFLKSIDYSSRWQRISYQLNEFTVVCQFMGLAYIGIIWFDYIPQNKLTELKSLMYYFIFFNNVGIYQEDVTFRIFNDLIPLLEPEVLLIKSRYCTRGGI